jgi:NAD(P)-dependent dehydrogenase (short-subunit alcohol dehydrogenase family)
MKEFKDKVAVVTGAASGIGRALAERCAQEGMKVVLAGINEDNLKAAEKELKTKGATTLVVRTDVSKPKDIESLAKQTIDTFGAVHLLCNNAGVGSGTTVWGSTLSDWQWTLGVNLWGVIYGIHFFVPIMLKQNTECHIVNTSSIAGLMGSAGMGPYRVSKHGVVALSECLYNELVQIGSHIGVSVLCPIHVKTRVLDCERDRPAELKNDPVQDQIAMSDPSRKYLAQAIENGLQPNKIADVVFDAIRENRFYILPQFEIVKAVVQVRMEDILQERNPTTLARPLK